MSEPRVLIQLSDPHVVRPGERAYGRVDTAAYLRRAVASVLRQPVAPLAVLVSGDLANHGHPEAYAQLKALLAPLACPVHLMPGNHDDRAALRAAFPEHALLQERAAGDHIQYEVALPGLRLLTLDTVVPGAKHGALCAARIDWLDRRLAQDAATPTVVAMHHPPVRSHLAYMDAIGLLEGADALAAVIRRHPQVCRVLCGHVHRSLQARWAGTVVQSAPSTAHQVWLDLTDDAGGAFGMDPPGYLVHAWNDTDPLVTHLAFVAPAEGPYPFENY